MAKRPFRFGVQHQSLTLEDWQDHIRRAEDLGFDILLMQDHFVPQLSPLPALLYAASVSSKLRLGTLVLDNDFRHPVMLAKEAATVDLLTEGRFELGIGTGSQPNDNAMSGIPFDAPGVRVERMIEYVKILKGYFSDAETLTFEGKHYHIKDLPAFPKTVQKPLPLMMGARGPRMLRLAAREANIVGILGGP